MITAKLIICAQDVVRDADTNTISVFNIYEGFKAEGFPLLLTRFAVVAMFERDPAVDPAQIAGHFEVRLGESVLGAGDTQIDFQDKSRTRQIVRINGLVIPSPGRVVARYTVADAVAEYQFEAERTQPTLLQLSSTPGANTELAPAASTSAQSGAKTPDVP